MFPDEIGIEIFSFLPISDICETVSLVCRQWNQWANNGSLWKHCYYRETCKRMYDTYKNSFSYFSICPQHDSHEPLLNLRKYFENNMVLHDTQLIDRNIWKQMYQQRHTLHCNINHVYNAVIRPHFSIHDDDQNNSHSTFHNQETINNQDHPSHLHAPSSKNELIVTAPTHNIYKLHGHIDAVKFISTITHGITVTASSDCTFKIWSLGNHDSPTINETTDDFKTVKDMSGNNPNLITSVELPDDPSSISTTILNLDPKSQPDNSSNPTKLDNMVMVSGLWNGDIILYRGISSLGNDGLHFSLQGHKDRVSTIRVSKDATRCISGSFDDSLRFWDIEAQREFRIVPNAHNDFVASSLLLDHCFPNGGNLLLTSSRDKTVKLWDMRSSSGNCEQKGLINQWDNESGVYRSDVGYNHNQFAYASYKGMLNVCDLRKMGNNVNVINDENQSKTKILKHHIHNGRITSLQWSGASMLGNYYQEYMWRKCRDNTQGDIITTGGKDIAVRMTKAFTGENIHSYEGFVGPPSVVNRVSQSTAVFTGSNDGALRTWDPVNGGIMNVYQLDSDVICSLSVDLPHVLVGFANGNLYEIDYKMNLIHRNK